MEDIQKYISCMEEIKLRQLAIKDIVEKKRSTTFEMTNIEFICLQFRKILELIAMASLTANKEQYEAAYRKFYKHWKAKQILNYIEEINPNFYPVPTQQVVENGKVTQTVPITEGFLTKDDFEKAYNDCSEVLHSKNPYNRKTINIEKLKESFGEWDYKIITLLNHHQIQLIDSKKQLWVLMQAESDGKVHAFEFEKIENTD